MICEYCHAELSNENSKFCPACGKRLQATPPGGIAAGSERVPEPVAVTEPGAAAGPDVPAVRQVGATAVLIDRPPVDAQAASGPEAHAAGPPEFLDFSEAAEGSAAALKRSVWKPMAAILAILVVGAGVAFAFLYVTMSPGKFVQELDEAILTQDEAWIRANFASDGGFPLDADAVAALCGGLSEPDVRSGLRQSLLDQAAGGEKAAGYDAFELIREPFLLPVFNEYKVMLRPVTFRVKSNVEAFNVDVTPGTFEAQPSEDGYIIRALPGTYTVLGRMDTEYNNAEATAKSAPCLSASSEGGALMLEFQVFDVDIRCSRTRNVTIFINGHETDLQPVDRVVTVVNAEPGMVVKAVAGRNDVEIEAEVVIRDKDSSYSFDFNSGNSAGEEAGAPAPAPVPAPAAPAAGTSDSDFLLDMERDALDNMVAQALMDYYRSYILCINSQDLGYLRNVTTEYLDVAAERMERNRDYYFEFQRMLVDRESIGYSIVGGAKTALIVAKFEYRYDSRIGRSDRGEGFSTQICELVFDERDMMWLVSSTIIDNGMVLGNDRIIMNN